MDEQDLYELFKDKVFGDLIDLNKIYGEFTSIDWYVPSQEIWIEAKCRKEVYFTHRIEQKKYNELIKKENPWYVVQDDSGIYIYDLAQLDEPCWREVWMKKTTEFGKSEYVIKSAADLDPRKRITFDSIFENN
jgi:hypothetical protein